MDRTAKDRWNWRELRNAPPRWSDLNALAHHRALKMAPFCLIVVPLAIKALEYAKDRGLLNRTLRLPVAIELLFVSGVAMLAASGLYSLRAPRLVKRYTTFKEFQDQGKGAATLAQEFAEDLQAIQPPAAWTAKNLRQIASDYAQAAFSDADFAAMLNNPDAALKHAQSLKIRAASLGDAFWAIRNYLDELRPMDRYVYMMLILAAIVLAGFVTAKNLLLTVKYILMER